MKQAIPFAVIVMFLATSPLIGQSDDLDRVDENHDFTDRIPREYLMNDLSTFNFQNIKPVLNQNRVELPLPLKKEKLEQYQISSDSSNASSNDFQPLKTRYKNGKLQLNPGETAVLKSNDILKRKLTTKKTYFPGHIIKVGNAGDNQENISMETWRMFMEAVHLPLTWQENESAYATDVRVILEATGDKQTSIDETVDVLFSTMGTGVNIHPEQVELTPDNSVEKVRLRCTKPSIKPKIRATNLQFGTIESSFDIEPVKLIVDPVDNPIFGFGLGSTRIDVTCKAGDGTRLTEETFPITIEKEGKGELENTRLTKPSGSSVVSTKLTSRGDGEVTLTARGASVESKPETITFVSPVFLLLISLVGGIAGGGVRLFRQRKNEKELNLMGALFVGGSAGILLVLATALGLGQLNVSTYLATTEAGALVLSLLGGYAGHGIFDWLSEKVGLKGHRGTESDPESKP